MEDNGTEKRVTQEEEMEQLRAESIEWFIYSDAEVSQGDERNWSIPKAKLLFQYKEWREVSK